MCDPMTAMAVAGGLSFALQTAGIMTEAGAASKNAEAENRAANENLRQQYSDLQARRIEEARSAAQRKDETAREARATAATAAVAASEAGVGGATGAEAVTNILGQEGRSIYAIEQNADMTQAQLTREAESLKAQADRRTNAAKARVPSAASVGIRILGSAVSNASSAYVGGKSLSAKSA